MVNLLIGSVFVQLAVIVFACIGLLHARRRQRAMVDQLALMERQCHRYSNMYDRQLEVGQNLSCLCILLQVAEKYRKIKPEKADGAILQAKQLSATSLDSIRQLKHMADDQSNCSII